MQQLRLILGALALFILLLTGCTPDPRRQAEADRIRTEAKSRADGESLDRLIVRETHEAEMLEQEQTRAARVAAWNAIWTTFKFAGSTALALALVALAVSFTRASYGIAVAKVHGAELQAALIKLDHVTRTYPQLLQTINGVPTLADPNGMTRQLTQPHEADRQLVTANGAVHLYGVAFKEAAQSSDPAGLGMARLPVIHSAEDGLYIGETFVDAIPLPKEITS